MADIIIVGGGPAGLSAAVNARIRNKSVLIITNDYRESYLNKAEQVNNYLGLPGLTGSELLGKCTEHARELGAEIVNKRVLTIMPAGDKLFASYGDEVSEAKAVILAPGVVQSAKYDGEAELLGKGVSYCATCDGMLYRGKKVAVIGKASDAVHEANFLKELGCGVTFISNKERPEGLSDGIQAVRAAKIEIRGDEFVRAVIADGQEIECEGVFILRQSIAPGDIMPGLEVEEGAIKTNEKMETSIAGVFAAGDCRGRPYQIAKAVGEGQVAALRAVEYIDKE